MERRRWEGGRGEGGRRQAGRERSYIDLFLKNINADVNYGYGNDDVDDSDDVNCENDGNNEYVIISNNDKKKMMIDETKLENNYKKYLYDNQ